VFEYITFSKFVDKSKYWILLLFRNVDGWMSVIVLFCKFNHCNSLFEMKVCKSRGFYCRRSFFCVVWFWNHLPLDDISLSYRINWPNLFSWYCVTKWRLCVTFSNLRISVKRVNGTALYTLLLFAERYRIRKFVQLLKIPYSRLCIKFSDRLSVSNCPCFLNTELSRYFILFCDKSK